MDGLRFKRDLGGEPVVEGMETLAGLNPQDALIAYIGELSNVSTCAYIKWNQHPQTKVRVTASYIAIGE